VKIRMKTGVSGTFHGYNGVDRGDVVDVDEANGLRYILNGMAEAVTKTAEKKVEREERQIEKAVVTEQETTALKAAVDPDLVIRDETPRKAPTKQPEVLDEPTLVPQEEQQTHEKTTVPTTKGTRGGPRPVK
jgi:hypothetical protein